jgi:hypothetical protein
VLLILPNAYVRETGKDRGRGVFAARARGAGGLVEACPVVLFAGSFASVPHEVRQLLFDWGVLSGTQAAPATHGLALGYGSRYDHDAVGGGPDSVGNAWFARMGVEPAQ